MFWADICMYICFSRPKLRSPNILNTNTVTGRDQVKNKEKKWDHLAQKYGEVSIHIKSAENASAFRCLVWYTLPMKLLQDFEECSSP